MSNIYKLTEYDLLATAINNDTYYICTDSKKMYKDIEDNRILYNVILIDTEIDRLYKVKPINGKSYYIWETNELWSYNGGWILIIGQSSSNNAYFYTDNNLSGVGGNILDNNGLLENGSVVIRDYNRIIKAVLSIDSNNNNLLISSFLGGGITLLPCGTVDERGSFIIEATKTYDEEGVVVTNEGKAIFKGDIYVEHIVNDISEESKLVSIKDLENLEINANNNLTIVEYDTVIKMEQAGVGFNTHTTSAAIEFSLPTATSGKLGKFALLVKMGGNHAITWSDSVYWAGATDYVFGSAGTHLITGFYDALNSKWCLTGMIYGAV